MIESLKWDSVFFGYPVGRIIVSGDQFSEESIGLNKFKLIYLFSDKKLMKLDTNISEVDIKTTLVKVINNQDIDTIHPSISEYNGGHDNHLTSLALESGVYSRFKKDPLFINEEYTKLYTRWIEDSINKKIADKLIVFSENSAIKGFVSLKFKEGYSEIGLLAVDEKSRGKGIAMALLNTVFKLTQMEGISLVRVVSQFENNPAIKLYEKAGFEIERKQYIYHLWN